MKKQWQTAKLLLIEYQRVKSEIYAHGKTSAAQFAREIELYTSLIQEKLEKGELEYEAPGM